MFPDHDRDDAGYRHDVPDVLGEQITERGLARHLDIIFVDRAGLPNASRDASSWCARAPCTR